MKSCQISTLFVKEMKKGFSFTFLIGVGIFGEISVSKRTVEVIIDGIWICTLFY